MKTSVSTKYQIAIPQKICKKYRIIPGMKLEWSEDLDTRTITLYPSLDENEMTPEQAVDELCGMLKGTTILKDYLKEKHKETEEEEKKFKKFLIRKK